MMFLVIIVIGFLLYQYMTPKETTNTAPMMTKNPPEKRSIYVSQTERFLWRNITKLNKLYSFNHARPI